MCKITVRCMHLSKKRKKKLTPRPSNTLAAEKKNFKKKIITQIGFKAHKTTLDEQSS